MDPQFTKKIQTRQELTLFIEMLCRDFRENRKEWENDDLHSFLEALGAWLDRSEDWYRIHGADPDSVSPWRRVADALAAARIYE